MFRAGSFLIILTFSLSAELWQIRRPPINNFNKHFQSDHLVLWYADSSPINDSIAGAVLEEMEKIFDFIVFKKEFGKSCLLSAERYKINCYLSEDHKSCESSDRQGYPVILLNQNSLIDKKSLAHEFCHAIQASYSNFRNNPYAHWLRESHAIWMTNQMYPDFADCSEPYAEIPYLHFGNPRHCTWQFLDFLDGVNGTGFIDNLWKKTDSIADKKTVSKDVFSTIMQSSGMNQLQFGDLFAEYAIKRSFFNSAEGQSKKCEIDIEKLLAFRYSTLQSIDSSKNLYAVPFNAAPQPYGYNIIRLLPEKSSADFTDSIVIGFRGIFQNECYIKKNDRKHPLEPHEYSPPGSDWRYALVVANHNSIRYSHIKRASDGNPDCILYLQPGDDQIYLVVAATPTNGSRIFKDQIYYSIYRYPWMVQIRGAIPDNYQGLFCADGTIHSNGGGFVASTASVDQSVYIGSHARVLDRAIVKGNVRIEDHAIVKGNAVIQDEAVISGDAVVDGGLVYGSAQISQYAKIWAAEIYGNAQVNGMAIIDHDSARIYGNARIGGTVLINGPADICGDAQLSGDGSFKSVSISSGIYYSLSDYFASKQLEFIRVEPETEITASPLYQCYKHAPADCKEKLPGNKELQIKAFVSNGTVTVSVNGASSDTASLELTDISGRVLFNSTINGNSTFSIPARVSQKVVLWKISNCEISKNGIVMADRY